MSTPTISTLISDQEEIWLASPEAQKQIERVARHMGGDTELAQSFLCLAFTQGALAMKFPKPKTEA